MFKQVQKNSVEKTCLESQVTTPIVSNKLFHAVYNGVLLTYS